MKRVSLLLAASIVTVGWLEQPAYSLPNDVECSAVYDRLQGIAEDAGHEAVEIDQIQMRGVAHVAGTHAKRFEEARADAVLSLMDFMDRADELARRFQSFCGGR